LDKHEKIMMGLEKLANAEGYALSVMTGRDEQGRWLIKLQAGQAKLYVGLGAFARAPGIVLEPFVEELIKQLRAER
jgi:hypothetical protein